MTGLEGATALGVVWGWLAGGRDVRGGRAFGVGAVLVAVTALAAAETAALAERAAALVFLVAAAAGFAVQRWWRAHLTSRLR